VTANDRLAGLRQPGVARVLLAGYLVVVAALTVAPAVEPWVLGHLDLLVARLAGRPPWEANQGVEPLANVALFVPLALLLCRALPAVRRRAVWLVCVAGSAGVELVQLLFLPGRTASVVDVVTNSTGAAIGVVLDRWLSERRRR
jgi:VanZ family protein